MTTQGDIAAALSGLSAEITAFLADVAGQISGGLTASEAEAVVSQIQGFTQQLKAADPGAPPATSTTTTSTSGTTTG